MRAYLISAILYFTLLTISSAQSPFPEPSGPEWEGFDKMAEYLCRGTGRWTGINPKHDPNNARSPEAFGLWFERPLNTMMTIQIIGYVQDSILLSAQGIFSWHPIKKHFVHITSDRANGYAEGITTFPNDTTFISTMVEYRADGRYYDHKDENFIISENKHRNTSFGKDGYGKWFEKGNWVWTRDEE